MRRTSKRKRFALCLDVLEERALLNGDPLGMWPLRDPSPETSVIARFAQGGPTEADRAILNSLGAYVAQSWQDGPSLIALGQGVDRDAALAKLNAAPDIVYAQLNNKLQAPDGRLALCALSPMVDEIMDIMRLRKQFNIYPTEREALESFS